MALTHRPRLAAAAAVLGVVSSLGVGVTSVSAAPASATAPRVAELNLDTYEAQVLVEVNAARQAGGLKPVKAAPACVTRMASRWSARIARTGVLEHRSQMVVIKRCRQSWAGETLIRGWELTPASMVSAWLDSPDHRAILMSSRARSAAVGVALDGEGRLVGVVNMARPSRR